MHSTIIIIVVIIFTISVIGFIIPRCLFSTGQLVNLFGVILLDSSQPCMGGKPNIITSISWMEK